MEYHGRVILRFRIVQHGEIIDRTCLFHRIVCKRHILRCQRLPVGERYIIAYRHRPGQPVLTDIVIRSEIIADGQVRIRHGQRALDQRLMDMFPGSPAIGRVKARLRLGVWIHGNDHRITLRTGTRCISGIRLIS